MSAETDRQADRDLIFHTQEFKYFRQKPSLTICPTKTTAHARAMTNILIQEEGQKGQKLQSVSVYLPQETHYIQSYPKTKPRKF